MIDALGTYGDTGDYYRLEHTSAADIQRLEIVLTTWLESVKIKVDAA